MNLFHRFWPNLLQEPDFVRNFATPLIKVRRRNDELAFFSMDGAGGFMALHGRGGRRALTKAGDTRCMLGMPPRVPSLARERDQRIILDGQVRPAHRGAKVAMAALPPLMPPVRRSRLPSTTRYYKGLGTSTAAEARSYFSQLDRHMSAFRYEGPQDDVAFQLAFEKDRADERKLWLLRFRYVAAASRAVSIALAEKGFLVVPTSGHADFGSGHAEGAEVPPPAAATTVAAPQAEPARAAAPADTKDLGYARFFDTDFIQFSVADTIRSIPSVVDGLKPSQRKVLFACLKRNLRSEMKVAQLSGPAR